MNTPKLPPLPDHPEPRIMTWSDLEKRAIREYGEACALAAIEAQGMPGGLHPIVSGAIFDFAGFLTSSDEVIPVGGSAESAPMVDRIQSWAKKRGLSLKDVAMLSWQHWLASAPPAPQSWPLPGWEVHQEPLSREEREVVVSSIRDGCNLIHAGVMQQEPVISTEHGPWIPSNIHHGETYCKRCLIRSVFAGDRQCDPHVAVSAKQAKPQPLSGEELLTGWHKSTVYANSTDSRWMAFLAGARFAESAHGIKE